MCVGAGGRAGGNSQLCVCGETKEGEVEGEGAGFCIVRDGESVSFVSLWSMCCELHILPNLVVVAHVPTSV